MPFQPIDSVLVGDRLCVRCGFNLAGQRIAREDRYDLLVVECPHCAQVAPIEEFPPLERWIGRWTMLLAALWLLLLVLLAAASIMLVGGLSFGFTMETTDRYDRGFSEDFRSWHAQTYPNDDGGSVFDPGMFRTFWAEHGEAMLEKHPRLRGIEWDEVALLLVPAGFALLFGGIWSVTLLQWRRLRLITATWVGTAPILLLLGVFWIWAAGIGMTSGEHVSWVQLRLPMLAVVVPLMVVHFDIGLLLGRPIARGVVRAFLPPRMRGALAFLWTVEGRPPPMPPSLRRLGTGVGAASGDRP